MFSKSRKSFVMLLLIVVIGLAGCGQPQSTNSNTPDDKGDKKSNPDALVLKASIQSPPTSDLAKGFDVYLDKIEERSDGRIEFERYYSESLAKAADHLNALTSNIADLALFVPSYTPGLLPLALIGTNPALWEDVWVGEMAYHDLYKTVPEMEEELKSHNVKWVGQYATPTSYVISNKPINSIEDIKGLKVIATGEMGTLAAQLGATPVGIPITDSYEAIERQTVDAVFYGLTTSVAYGLEDAAKYVYKIPLGATAGLYGMNLDVWNKLPEDLQDIILEVASEHPEDFHQIYQIQGQEEAIKKFEAKNVQFIEPTDEDKQKVQDVAKPIRDKWIQDNESKGLPGQEIMEAFQSFIEKYEKENPFAEK